MTRIQHVNFWSVTKNHILNYFIYPDEITDKLVHLYNGMISLIILIERLSL